MNTTPAPSARARLERLRGDAEVLAARLEQAAEAMQRIGAAPDAALSRDLRELDLQLKALLTEFPRPPHCAAANVWDVLGDAVRRLEQRTMVAPQLRLVLRLTHRSQEDFEPLAAAQQAATDWLERLEGDLPLDAPVLDALLTGKHGLSALVRLATNAGELSDGDWVDDQNIVADAYGRSLALAAARGQLQLNADATAAVQTAQSPAAPAAEPAPMETVSRKGSSGPAGVVHSATTSAAVAEPVLGRQTPTNAARAPIPTSTAAAGAVMAHRSSALPNTPRESAALVRRIQKARGPARKRELLDLLATLMQHNRWGLAWQLNRSLESLYGGRIPPGPEILLVAACGSQLCDRRGALAQLLTQGLSPGTVSSARLDPPGMTRVQRLVLQTGLLRAAWIAPATGAAHWLARCAACEGAEARLGRIAELLLRWEAELPVGRDQAGDAAAPQHGDLRRFQQLVRDWQATWRARGVDFRKSEPLFARQHWSVRSSPLHRSAEASPVVAGWLSTLRIADTVLAPILTDAQDARADVRRTVGRINSRLLVGHRADFPSGTDAIIVPHDEMRQYLQEAAQWAQRWLQGDTADAAEEVPGDTPCAALRQELRSEVASLSAELAAAQEPAAPPILQVAQACWARAVSDFANLLSQPAGLEPTGDEILGGDIRRLRLGPLGPLNLPQCGDAEFIDRLLEALSSEEHWTLLFTVAAVSRGPAAESRLDNVLEGDVLSLEDELNAMAEALEAAAECGALSEREHADWSARLCAVWGPAPHDPASRLSAFRDLQQRLAARGIQTSTASHRSDVNSTVAVRRSAPTNTDSLLFDDDPQ